MSNGQKSSGGSSSGSSAKSSPQRPASAAAPKEKKEASPLLIGIFVLVLLLLGVYGYYWAQSDYGIRTIVKVKNFAIKYNPFTWFMKEITKAQDVSQNIWSSAPNRTSSVKGLLFKSFKSIGTEEFPQGAPISLEYNLELRNINVDNLPITIHCGIKGKKIHSGGEGQLAIQPSNPLYVTGYRIYDDIRCFVPAEVTKDLEGTTTFVGSVSFPFKTKDVTLPVYFTTKNVERSLEGDDFFSHFAIDQSQPIRATYNGEPIEIGIGVSTENKQPVIIGPNRHPLVGISLKNKWAGYMPELKELKLEVPSEMTLNSDLSKNPNQLCPFVTSRTGTQTNEYTIAEDIRKDLKISPGRTRSFECWFDVAEDIVESGAFYSKKFYRVNADYKYNMENKTATITIKPPKDRPSSVKLTEIVGS